ncbi:hypothetical protein RB195_026371 [Necator americanus]
MRLDTGADVTMLSTGDWTAMGRPKLQPSRLTLKSANNEPINFRGCYECNFIIDDHLEYVKPADGVLQQHMDALIAGIDGTSAYLDDIFVTSRTIGLHNTRLKTEISYVPWVRHQRTRTRLDPEKIKAIQKMPATKDFRKNC